MKFFCDPVSQRETREVVCVSESSNSKPASLPQQTARQLPLYFRLIPHFLSHSLIFILSPCYITLIRIVMTNR